jgi:cytoskeletal protein RodZ
MRTSTAYFAGVGTVIFAVAAGLGGGYLAANIVSPHEPKYGTETSRLERRMASEPSAAATAAAEPARHITAAHPATPIATQASVVPTVNPAVQPAVAVPTSPIEASEASVASQQTVATSRASDARRAAVEKRRAERRQEKRRARQLREQELDAGEQRIGQVSDPRQAFAFGPPRGETQRIMLFGAD